MCEYPEKPHNQIPDVIEVLSTAQFRVPYLGQGAPQSMWVGVETETPVRSSPRISDFNGLDCWFLVKRNNRTERGGQRTAHKPERECNHSRIYTHAACLRLTISEVNP